MFWKLNKFKKEGNQKVTFTTTPRSETLFGSETGCFFVSLVGMGIFLILLSACASSTSTSIYNFDYPLTNQTVQSQYMDLSVNVPLNWFAVEDNECDCIDLLLINKERNTSIKFIPINIDSTAAGMNEKLTLKDVLGISKKFRQAALGNKFHLIGDDEFFEVNSFSAASYKYADENGIIKRIVVFLCSGKYFESIAGYLTKESNSSEEALKELFRIQNSVLNSVK